MTRSKRNRAFAASLFFAALLSLACEGPDADARQRAAQKGGAGSPNTEQGVVVRCGVCRGMGKVRGFDGTFMDCEACEGTGKVKYTKHTHTK
jgi:RecJ-like exonuclease